LKDLLYMPPRIQRRGFARPGQYHAPSKPFTVTQKKKIYDLFKNPTILGGHEAFHLQRFKGGEVDVDFINPENWISSSQFTSQFSTLAKLRNEDPVKFAAEMAKVLDVPTI